MLHLELLPLHLENFLDQVLIKTSKGLLLECLEILGNRVDLGEALAYFVQEVNDVRWEQLFRCSCTFGIILRQSIIW